jgi:hypothetical protein
MRAQHAVLVVAAILAAACQNRTPQEPATPATPSGA